MVDFHGPIGDHYTEVTVHKCMKTRYYSTRLHSPKKSSSEIDIETAVLCGALGVLWYHTLIPTLSYGVEKSSGKLKKNWIVNLFPHLRKFFKDYLEKACCNVCVQSYLVWSKSRLSWLQWP